MNFSKRNKSIVDFMFIIALFGAFAITGLFVVLFGAKVYQTTVDNMDANYSSRTALSYVTEKIRAHDFSNSAIGDAVEIDENDGQSVIKLKEIINDKEYITYLFVAEGYLKEFTASSDYDFDYSKGTDIIKVDKFEIAMINHALYHVEIVDEYGNDTQFYVTLYSAVNDAKGGNNE